MPSRSDKSETPYSSENQNLRPDGEGRPPQPGSTPEGAEGSAVGSKTRTDPQTGEPTGRTPEVG